MINILSRLQLPERLLQSINLWKWGLLAPGLFMATSCASSAAEQQLRIDGDRALEHTARIVDFGPRIPGSDAVRQVGDYIIGQLESFQLQVMTDSFQPLTPKGRIDMRNIWGILEGDPDSVIMLASHYDSKWYQEFRFDGANDGGSSSGLLLELARVLASNKPLSSTIWFTFFDGEEAFNTWTDQDSLYGSRRFVERLQQAGSLYTLRAMVLLDLIGGEDLVLYRDVSSTDWLTRLFWSKAAGLGHGDIFRLQGTTAATDDHIPFARAGVPVIDIIDLDYAHWHRETDTIDQISKDSLQVVGDVVLATLPDLEKRLKEAP